MLNAHGRFAIPVAMAVVFNCHLFNGFMVGSVVSWLPWAVLTAGLVTCAIHLLAVWSVGVRIVPRWRADQRYRDLRQALGPAILAGVAQQIGVAMESFWRSGWWSRSTNGTVFCQSLAAISNRLGWRYHECRGVPELARRMSMAALPLTLLGPRVISYPGGWCQPRWV